MKIIYLVHQFYPHYFSGTEKFILNLATTMQAQGHKVKVITYTFRSDMKDYKKDGGIIYKQYFVKGVPVLSFSYDKTPADVHYAAGEQSLQDFAEKVLAKEKPDIVHVGHPMRVFSFIKAAVNLKIPYIITPTDFWLLCYRGIMVNAKGNLCSRPDSGNACEANCPDLPAGFVRSRLQATRDILTRAEYVCAPSNFLGNIFRNEIPSLKIKIVNLGLCRLSYSLKKYGKKGQKIKFIYGGTWLPHKGVHILLEAFSKTRNKNAVLYVYGFGPDEEYNAHIQNYAKKDPRIILKGRFKEDDMDNIFMEADVSIVPSIWWENTPYMMNEALARCVPAIVSDVGGLTEKVKHNHNGFVFRMGDAKQLKDIIEKIMDNPQILNTVQKNLVQFVQQTVEQEAYAYEKLYKECLSLRSK